MLHVTIAKDEDAFDDTAAVRIFDAMHQNPYAVIGLSTGETTRNMHRIAAEIFACHPFDVSDITIFNVDELTNLPRSYKGCCWTMIKEQFVDPIGIQDYNFIMPQTISDDYEKESRDFQAKLEARGGIALLMLGLGANGHIGINQPGTPFNSETWVSPMDSIFEARVRRETGVPLEHKLGGLTLGIRTIMHSRKIVLVAKGKHKADIVEKMLLGPITEEIPASVLQLHPNCEFLLDADAAQNITAKLPLAHVVIKRSKG